MARRNRNRGNKHDGKNSGDQKISKKQKKQLKKEKKMKNNIGFIQRATNAVAGVYNRFTLTKPVDTKDPETLNIVLFKQSFLNQIADQCIPVAGGSEFQTHYRAVQFLIEKPGVGRIIYTIPTVFYNFTQEVSTSAVDYNLIECDKNSKEVQPLSMEIAGKVNASFPASYFQSNGFTVTVREDDIGSIHRHPGDFSFSSIDLDNDPSKPGVIYRRGNAEDLPQTDSVMYITGSDKNHHVKLVTTQTRVVTTKNLGLENGVEGQYAKAKTLTLILKDVDETQVKRTRVDFNMFTKDSESVISVDETTKSDSFLPRVDDIKLDEVADLAETSAMIFKILIAKNYNAVNKLDPNLIKNRTYVHYTQYNSYGGRQNTNRPKNAAELLADRNATPNSFTVEEVLEANSFSLDKLTVLQLKDDIIRSIYWNCAGSKNKVEFKIGKLNIKIDLATSTSYLIRVTKGISASYVSKQMFSDYDLTEELTGVFLEDIDDAVDKNGLTQAEQFELMDAADESEEPTLIPTEEELQSINIFEKVYPKYDRNQNGFLNLFNSGKIKMVIDMMIPNKKLVFESKEVDEKAVILSIDAFSETDKYTTVTFKADHMTMTKMVDL